MNLSQSKLQEMITMSLSSMMKSSSTNAEFIKKKFLHANFLFNLK